MKNPFKLKQQHLSPKTITKAELDKHNQNKTYGLGIHHNDNPPCYCIVCNEMARSLQSKTKIKYDPYTQGYEDGISGELTAPHLLNVSWATESAEYLSGWADGQGDRLLKLDTENLV